jgi:formylglycine-generating enzyme required for sulfatase activity
LGTPDKKKDWDQDDCQVNNNWTEQPGLTGSGKLCISGFSAYDMIGNVWEWVNEQSINGRLGDNDLPQDGYVRSVDLSGLPLETSQTVADSNFNDDYFWVKKGVRGLARGGYWGNKSDAGLFAVYLVAEPTFAGTGVGFRCVK